MIQSIAYLDKIFTYVFVSRKSEAKIYELED